MRISRRVSAAFSGAVSTTLSDREINRIHELGYAEVKNFGLAAAGNKDVRWLDIAMDDAFLVGCLQPVGDL